MQEKGVIRINKKYDFNIEELSNEFLIEGNTVEKLSEKYNCSITTIKRYLNKNNNNDVIRKLKGNKYFLDKNIIINEFLNTKISIGKLSKKYDVSYYSIEKILKESKDNNVLKKIKENNTKNRETSIIENLNEDKIVVYATNTKKPYIFPSYLKKRMAGYSWSESKLGGYLKGMINGKFTQAHHLVLKPPNGFLIDHIDGNPQNNMPENLRIVTPGLNNQNVGLSKNKVGYKGVYYKNKSYFARYFIGKEHLELGGYKTKEESAYRYFDIKANLVGFEYMRQEEIEEYNRLATFLINTKNTRR